MQNQVQNIIRSPAMILNGLKTNIFEESIMARKTPPRPRPPNLNNQMTEILRLLKSSLL